MTIRVIVINDEEDPTHAIEVRQTTYDHPTVLLPKQQQTFHPTVILPKQQQTFHVWEGNELNIKELVYNTKI